jgi:hypothetical protein
MNTRKLLTLPLGVLCSLSILTGMGCEADPSFLNVAPAITSVGPIVPGSDGTVRIFLTIQDFEEDPVDIVVEVIREDGSTATWEEAAGMGHGSTGLSSKQMFPGTPHEVVWKPTSDSVGPLHLKITPNDRIGGEGLPFSTSSFEWMNGLDETEFTK